MRNNPLPRSYSLIRNIYVQQLKSVGINRTEAMIILDERMKKFSEAQKEFENLINNQNGS